MAPLYQTYCGANPLKLQGDPRWPIPEGQRFQESGFPPNGHSGPRSATEKRPLRNWIPARSTYSVGHWLPMAAS